MVLIINIVCTCLSLSPPNWTMLLDGKDRVFPPPLLLSPCSALNTVGPGRMHSAVSVSVLLGSLSRALLSGEMEDEPAVHVTTV